MLSGAVLLNKAKSTVFGRAIPSAITKSNNILIARTFGVTSAPPQVAPPKSPYNIEPDTEDATREEMRLHYRTYEESEYKLGKHRSNALELVEKHPVIVVDGEQAICDGGGGALGHPLEYISLQRPGVIERCKYCGLRYASKVWYKGEEA